MTKETQHAAPGPSSPRPTRPLPAPGTFGPYIVTGEIGHGGFGTVYRTRHAQLGTEYALKVIRPDVLDEEILERFFREMAILASLNHPGIVRVHTSGRTARGEPYYVMELLVGSGLDKKLDRVSKLPVREAASLLAKVARGVGYAHGRGIVHRDLKPENILVTEPDDEPRIVDFGLAIGNERERLTRAGDMIGTPMFMAPEQIEGSRDLTPGVDVWALGVILFLLTTGRLPYGKGGGTLAVLQAVLTREPPFPSSLEPSLPCGVDEVFLRCCERKPGDRYANALELVPDLEALARGESPGTEGRVEARRAAKVRRRRVRRALGLVVVGLLLASILSAVFAVTVVAEARQKQTAAREALGKAREGLESAIRLFDPIPLELGDPQLDTEAKAVLRAFDLYRSSSEAAKKVGVFEEVPAERLARWALAATLVAELETGNRDWDRIPGIGERSADPLYAFPGARLALASGDGELALARLAQFNALPTRGRASLEAIRLQLVAAAAMQAAARSVGQARCGGHIRAALAAGFVPERTPPKLAPELAKLLEAVDDELSDVLEVLMKTGSREIGPLLRLRHELERLVRAAESLGTSSYRSEELLSLAARYENRPEKMKVVETFRQRALWVDTGDQLFSAHRESEAFDSWDKALLSFSVGALRDDRYPAIFHWIVVGLAIADRRAAAEKYLGEFPVEDREDVHYRVALCWHRFRWSSDHEETLKDLDSVLREIEGRAELAGTSLRGEVLFLRGEARLAGAGEMVSLPGLRDLIEVMRDAHARNEVRKLAAQYGKHVAAKQNPKLVPWFDDALSGKAGPPPPK